MKKIYLIIIMMLVGADCFALEMEEGKIRVIGDETLDVYSYNYTLSEEEVEEAITEYLNKKKVLKEYSEGPYIIYHCGYYSYNLLAGPECGGLEIKYELHKKAEKEEAKPFSDYGVQDWVDFCDEFYSDGGVPLTGAYVKPDSTADAHNLNEWPEWEWRFSDEMKERLDEHIKGYLKRYRLFLVPVDEGE